MILKRSLQEVKIRQNEKEGKKVSKMLQTSIKLSERYKENATNFSALIS